MKEPYSTPQRRCDERAIKSYVNAQSFNTSSRTLGGSSVAVEDRSLEPCGWPSSGSYRGLITSYATTTPQTLRPAAAVLQSYVSFPASSVSGSGRQKWLCKRMFDSDGTKNCADFLEVRRRGYAGGRPLADVQPYAQSTFIEKIS
jgi:hypothetical protein